MIAFKRETTAASKQDTLLLYLKKQQHLSSSTGGKIYDFFLQLITKENKFKKENFLVTN